MAFSDYKKVAVKKLFSTLKGAPLGLEFWDGEQVSVGEGAPQLFVRVKEPFSLGQDPLTAVAEAYARCTIDIDGELDVAIKVLYSTAKYKGVNPPSVITRASRVLRNTIKRSYRDIAWHYDAGNEFFALWLDPALVYSCGYFRRANDDLALAQQQKLSHIAKKLLLQRDMRVLDIGCGWGALLIHLAKCYSITGVGITLSREQANYANAKIKNEGLEDRIRVEVADYREFQSQLPFDRVVSVGMVEHVGKARLAQYVKITSGHLREGGRGVLHGIGRTLGGEPVSWITRHIFPGSYLPSIAEITAPMADNHLAVLDVEVWREHYAKTFDHWITSFEAERDSIAADKGEEFYRMWRLFLYSVRGNFRYGNACVFQIQYGSGFPDDQPLTREYLSIT